MGEIDLNEVVIPRDPTEKWSIGQIVERSLFNLSIGPLYRVKDFYSEKIIEVFPMFVNRLVRCSESGPVLLRIVTPKKPNEDWVIGHVIGLVGLNRPGGPKLQIRDMVSRKVFEAISSEVDRLLPAAYCPIV